MENKSLSCYNNHANEIEKIKLDNHLIAVSRTQEIEFLLNENIKLMNMIKQLKAGKKKINCYIDSIFI